MLEGLLIGLSTAFSIQNLLMVEMIVMDQETKLKFAQLFLAQV